MIDLLAIFPRRYALENDKKVTNDFKIAYILDKADKSVPNGANRIQNGIVGIR